MADLSYSDEAVVVLRARHGRRRLVFRDPVHPNAFARLYPLNEVDCVVDMYDSGLEAHATFRTDGGDGLVEFLHGLAADFRGWAGKRHWGSNYDDPQVEATHDRLGHVTLLFRFRYGPEPWEGYWDLSLPFTVEAGAEMLNLADEFEAFFAPPPGYEIPNKA